MYRMGIDLGGTKVEGAVLDEGGKVLFRERIATEQEKGYEHILQRIRQLYKQMAAAFPGPHTLGIGTPGAVSRKTGKLKNSNTVCLNGRLSPEDLEKILGHPLVIENDANCFAMAEALLGAGRGKRHVFGVILGTGCGGGIVMDGKLVEGLQGIAGEWGHMVIDPAGPDCYCGAKGCVETFISGSGMRRLSGKYCGEILPFEEIACRYLKKDPGGSVLMELFLCVSDRPWPI